MILEEDFLGGAVLGEAKFPLSVCNPPGGDEHQNLQEAKRLARLAFLHLRVQYLVATPVCQNHDVD